MKLQSVQEARNHIARIATAIKAGKEDFIVGIRKIHGFWLDSELPEDDDYNAVVLFDSDTDTIIKGDIQKNFSLEFIQQQKKEETEYLEVMKEPINKLLENLSRIPIIEEVEDPYEWPENYN